MARQERIATSAPCVVAVGGLVASGKSHVARALAARLAAEHVEADRVREDLRARAAPRADSLASRRLLGLGGLFGAEVYAELRRRAERALASRRSVVVDACFPRVEQREALRSLARRVGATFLFVECRAADSVREQRLAARDAREELPGWPEIAEALAQEWQPVDELPAPELLRIDSGGPLEEALATVLACLAARRPAPPGEGAGPWAAVTFDCWNTLIYEPSWERAHAQRVEALVRAAGEAGREVGREEASRAFDAAWDRHMRLWREGVATGASEVAVWALAELGLREPRPALEHLTRQFEEASHSGEVTTLPGAGETLEHLARSGARRALVCDTGLTSGRVVRLHLARLGLLELLEVTVFSDEVGVPKPDPRAFRAALAPLAVEPRAALHVGDLRRTDVAGARGLGMSTVRILARHDDESALPEADYVVRSHAELQALLGAAVATP
jgi:HAD superfamily hydrolase (TIGR01509 family)